MRGQALRRVVRGGVARGGDALAVARRQASSAVAFDVDGVLVRGGATVAAAPVALQRLRSADIPFLFMTNGGGHVEARRAGAFGEKFGVDVAEWQVCQSHTPMRALADRHGDETVLVLGKRYENLAAIAASYGFKHAVTVEELHAAYPLLYPDAPPDGGPRPPGNWADAPFGAVLAFNDPLLWGRELQLCCDVLRSGHASAAALGTGAAAPAATQNVPLYSGCADFLYAAEHPHPRFGSGASMAALKALFEQLAGQPLDVADYGKPHAVSYDYVSNVLRDHMRDGDALDRVFMIGDNPITDILGAKNAGRPWFSILVKSGMWQEGDDTGGADAIVDDVAEAMDIILQFEADNAAAA